MHQFKNNLFYLNLISICRNGLFFQPILFAYFDAKGIATGDILFGLSLFNFALVFMEVPAGYIADLISRKKILLFASILFLLSFVNFYLLESIIGLIVSHILLAIGVSFYSGLIPSIIYDSLLSEGKEADYKRHMGKINANAAYMAGFAALVGGFLYAWHIDLPILVNCAVFIVAVVLVLKIKDVEIERDKIEQSEGKLGFVKQLGRYVKYITIDHPELKWIIGLSVVMSIGTALNLQLLQPLWKAHQIPIWAFGILMLTAQVGSAIATSNTHWVVLRFGERNIILVLWVLLVICYMVMGSIANFVAVGFSLLPPVIMGFTMTIISDMSNRCIDSKMRVTMASVNATAFRIFAAIFLQLSVLAFAFDAINYFYIMMAFIIFLLGGILLYKMNVKQIFLPQE